MQAPGYKIVTLPNGENTLKSLTRNETYHNCGGPLQEATTLHISQNLISERCRGKRKFVIWDVGLGAAGNAIAALHALEGCEAEVEIHSFDISTNAAEFALSEAESLSYLKPYRAALQELIEKGSVELAPNRKWIFHREDFCHSLDRTDLPPANAVFYDPYSPATNREMWTLDLFTKLRKLVSEDCTLTSYSRSTAVRVTLLLAGFLVGIGRSIENKAETTVAATNAALLDRPLGKKFLERVKISRNGSPMREAVYSIVPISPADLTALELHSQFQH